MSPENLESLEETLTILFDPATMDRICQAEAEIANGDFVEGADAVRALRSRD